MAGHSKWANIQHRKGRQDEKRGKIWTRITREIIVSARLGGGDLSLNPRLRLAIEKAKAANMPADNIKRNVDKATGNLDGVVYDEIRYEGYGVGGAAIIVDTMTDNRVRTVAEVRFAFSKNGGNMGTEGSVAFQFKHCGQLVFAPGSNEDQIMEIALEAGAGKTVTLQTLAEGFSKIGVPVFMADVKGDLAGISQPGTIPPKLAASLQERGVPMPEPIACPTTLWDVFGKSGHPVRATITDMGPLLLGRMLNLNDTQAGVLNMVFKIADDQGLLLLDLKDLRAMLQHVGEHARDFTTEYGNVSAASIGAIQRALLEIESQGGDAFFGEPMLNIQDFIQTDAKGMGVINLLAADKLMNAPRLYGTFLLWMLSELFEQLPEVGDVEKPKMVFFFDEAHLLFNEAPKVLLERIELLVRLIRSKGVGVYFVTQNPLDVPETVLGQLGNRVQHALRAFTPRDQKAVKATAQTMRGKAGLDIEKAITELGVGEALVSLLDAKGRPSETEQAYVLLPGSQLGPITPEQRQALLANSLVAGVYEQTLDRESAYERLKGAAAGNSAANNASGTGSANSSTGAAGQATVTDQVLSGLGEALFGSTGPRGGQRQGLAQMMVKSAVRNIGSAMGREIVRGVMGSILGGRKR